MGSSNIQIRYNGNSREPVEVKTALVSMDTRLNQPWKQALWFYLLESSGNQGKMHEIVIATLAKIHDIGLTVIVIVWDQGPLNTGVRGRTVECFT